MVDNHPEPEMATVLQAIYRGIASDVTTRKLAVFASLGASATELSKLAL